MISPVIARHDSLDEQGRWQQVAQQGYRAYTDTKAGGHTQPAYSSLCLVTCAHTGMEALQTIEKITPGLLVLNSILRGMAELGRYGALRMRADLFSVPTLLPDAISHQDREKSHHVPFFATLCTQNLVDGSSLSAQLVIQLSLFLLSLLTSRAIRTRSGGRTIERPGYSPALEKCDVKDAMMGTGGKGSGL